MRNLLWMIPLAALACGPATGQTGPVRSRPPAIEVGWHDEMNDPSLWRPLGLENQPDIYASRPGALTLRLPHVPDGFPYLYQWSGVTRSISTDLGRFPVLVADVGSLGDGSYAHLEVEVRDIHGRPVRTWRSPTLVRSGLTALDLGKELGPDVWRLTLRLIVGGKLAGAKCEYNWIRFVRRQDMARLREAPDFPHIVSREPSADAPAHARSDGAVPAVDGARR